MSRLRRLDDLEVAGRRVLVRADLNVPLDGGEVGDDFRIREAVPNIRALRERGARTVIVASHLGRPKGRDPELSLQPVAERLAELGGFPVAFAGDTAGPEAQQAVAGAPDGSVVVVENTRFEPGETENDPALAGALASLADEFVLDAFGSAHRAHASTVGVAARLPAAASDLVAAEVDALTRLLEDPPRPYVVVLGGAKVSGKLGVMQALLPKVDAMLVGGGMCYTLLVAEGYPVGDSLVDESKLDEVGELLRGPHGGRVMVATDTVVAAEFAAAAEHQVVPTAAIPDGWVGVDIGPETSAAFGDVVRNAGSVFWNGPMGVFEWEPFRAGTRAVAEALAASHGYTVVGGGDTVAALREFGLEDAPTHVSTGGGAGLELLEGETLPALAVLEKGSA